MRLRLQERQETNSNAQELRQQGQKRYEKVDGMLHHQGLLFVPKTIRIELISRYQTNLLAGHFDIEKTCEFLIQKYYWPTFHHNVKTYVKSCDVCLASKAVRRKPYGNLQFLLVPTYQ